MSVPAKQTAAVSNVKKRSERSRNTMVLTSIVTAYGSGWLYKKNPNWRTIGETNIKTGAVVGGGGVILSLLGKGRMTAVIGGVGLGFLLPTLAEMGAGS